MRMNSEFASAEIVTTRELMMPSLGHRVPQQALHHHRSHVREQRGALPHVRKVRQHEFMQRRRCGSDAQHLARACATPPVRHFPVGYAIMSYHDRKALD